jgi:GDP-L-fucose synthase
MVSALVTGATGFLGMHLVKKLKNKGFKVYMSNTKIANLEKIENLIQEFSSIKFDYIFHLAAVTKAGDYCVNHPGDQWIQNQTINTNILKYWKEFQPQAKMICMGTSCSYAPGIHMTEENYLLGEPEDSLYAYAMTKRMLLLGLQSIGRQYGLKWLYFIPSTLYGPDFELDDNHFIFDFIRNCYNAKYKDKQFVVWGDGNQRRELIYVGDAADAMINLLKYENEVFNLGSGEDYSINEFAEIVCKNYEYDTGSIKHDLTKYVGVKEKKLDTAKVLKFLEGKSFLKTSLGLGLKKTIRYFKEEMK